MRAGTSTASIIYKIETIRFYFSDNASGTFPQRLLTLGV